MEGLKFKFATANVPAIIGNNRSSYRMPPSYVKMPYCTEPLQANKPTAHSYQLTRVHSASTKTTPAFTSRTVSMLFQHLNFIVHTKQSALAVNTSEFSFSLLLAVRFQFPSNGSVPASAHEMRSTCTDAEYDYLKSAGEHSHTHTHWLSSSN